MRTPSSSPFRIEVDTSLEVRELEALARRSPVSRTSHIGNQWPSDLAVLSLGVALRQVDKNYSVTDVLYKPEARVADGEATVLSAQAGVLAPYLATSDGRSVAAEHLEATRRAVPGGRVSTYSSDYMAEIDRVEPVLGVIADVAPEAFNRITRADGSVARFQGADERRVRYGDETSGVVEIDRRELVPRTIRYFEHVDDGLTTLKPVTGAGHVLLKADVDILLQGIIDAVAEGPGSARRVHQCCGLSMARYATNPRLDKAGTIARMYGEVRRRIGDLPEIELVLIPVTWLRFAYIDPVRLAAHEAIVASEAELARIDRERGEAVKRAPTPEARRRTIEEFQARSLAVRRRREASIGELAKGVVHSPFYGLISSEGFTQYDVLARGAAVRIPADVRGRTMRDLRVWAKRLLKKRPELRAGLFG